MISVSRPWEGKQLWIYVLSSCPTPKDLVRQATDMGLTGLMVKGWDGTSWDYWTQQVAALATPCHDAGLRLGAWGYCYGTDPRGEAAAAKDAIDAGAQWLILDCEIEFEQHPDRAAGMRDAFATLKAAGVPIGLTSFGWPDLHPDFPWASFGAWVDVWLPQVYWWDAGWTVAAAWRRAMDGCRKWYGNKPLIPAGQLYQARGAYPPAHDVRYLADLAQGAGLDGVSWYAWDSASLEGLAAVKEASFLGQSQPDAWAKDAWEWAQRAGIADGTDPRGQCTREQVVEMLYRYDQYLRPPVPKSIREG